MKSLESDMKNWGFPIVDEGLQDPILGRLLCVCVITKKTWHQSQVWAWCLCCWSRSLSLHSTSDLDKILIISFLLAIMTSSSVTTNVSRSNSNEISNKLTFFKRWKLPALVSNGYDSLWRMIQVRVCQWFDQSPNIHQS